MIHGEVPIETPLWLPSGERLHIGNQLSTGPFSIAMLYRLPGL